MVLTVLGQVAFMPVLVLAAKLCPEVSHEIPAQAAPICKQACKRCPSSLLTCGVSLVVPATVMQGFKNGPLAVVPAMTRVRPPAEGQIWLAGSGGDTIRNFDVDSQRWLFCWLCSGIWAYSGLRRHGDQLHVVGSPRCGEHQTQSPLIAVTTRLNPPSLR